MTDDTDDEIPPGTVCPLCGVGCRLEPSGGESDDTASRRAQGVTGPANPNGRLCRKGVGAFDVRAERLRRPTIRPDGPDGPERQVSWEQAFEHVTDTVTSILDSHGPDALAFLGAPHCTNEESYLLQKIARTLGTNNVDNRSRLCHVSSTRTLEQRLGLPATTNSLADLTEADVILVAGANPAARQPVAFNSFVRPAVTSGATLVHVDPVGNRTTRLADIHLAPRPDTDALVFDLVSARLADGSGGSDRSGGAASADGFDETFLTARTRGAESFRTSLATYDSERATTIAGVEADTLDETARAIADADRVAGLVGTGIEDTPGEASAAGALLNLLLATGNVGRRGTGLFVLRGLVNEQGAADVGCAPDRLPGYQPVTDETARERLAAEWGVGLPADPGKTATELLASFGDEIRGALVVGENPAVSKDDPEWIRERLASLETLVVVDVVASETTAYADVILPAAAGVEKDGTVTNLERRVQRSPPTQSPPGRARPDFEILRELGRRLTPDRGLFDYAGPSEAFAELTRVAPTHAGLSFDELGIDGEQWPAGAGSVLYDEQFETDDGRARLGETQPLSAFDTESGLRLVAGGRTSEANAEDDVGERPLRVHPADAADHGIEAGDLVAVSAVDPAEASSDGTVDGGSRTSGGSDDTVGEDEATSDVTDDAARTTVEARVTVDETVRRGTVYLPARVADPLVRRDGSTVTISPAAS